MCRRLELISILTSISLCFICVSAKYKPRHGPGGMSFNDTTTCAEFSKFGRFNPYSVLHDKWFVFYYWGPPKPYQTYIFTFPTANHTKFLHKLLDGKTILPVDWSARQILMENQKNETSLLVERGDRGEYWRYLLYRVTKGHKINPRDVRLKQTADNRILGYMDCDRKTLLVMSRINEVPRKRNLQDEAARLGFKGRRGKSYLYQGHEWMPIPEDDEERYWQPKKTEEGTETSLEEVKSSERSSEEEELQPTDVPEETKENEKNNAEMQPSIDESELKERCIAIQPEFCDDQANCGSVKEPSNTAITMTQLNTLETDMVIGLETIQSTNAPDSSLVENKPQNNFVIESENTQIDELENDQRSPEFEKTSNVPEKHLINEEPKSTSESYVPENTRSRKNIEKTPAIELVSPHSSK